MSQFDCFQSMKNLQIWLYLVLPTYAQVEYSQKTLETFAMLRTSGMMTRKSHRKPRSRITSLVQAALAVMLAVAGTLVEDGGSTCVCAIFPRDARPAVVGDIGTGLNAVQFQSLCIRKTRQVRSPVIATSDVESWSWELWRFQLFFLQNVSHVRCADPLIVWPLQFVH